MKNKKIYHTVETAQTSNREIIERGKIDTTNTHLHYRSLSGLGTGTLLKSGRIKLVLWTLPQNNSEQSYKGKDKTHKYINRQNQSTTGKLWKP